MRRVCPRCALKHQPHCPDARWWPIAPLVAMAGGWTSLAAQVGASGDSMRHAAEYGLSDARADRWAVKCGLHPANVWDGWEDAGLTELDRAFLETGWRPAWEWSHEVAS